MFQPMRLRSEARRAPGSVAVSVATLLLVTSAISVASQSPSEAAPGGPFEVGRAFPDVVLPAADDGQPLSISRFRGRKVLLHIFASW